MIVIQSQNGLEWKLGTIDDFNDLIKSDKAKNFVSCSLPVNDSGAYEKFFEHRIDRIYLLANIIKNK